MTSMVRYGRARLPVLLVLLASGNHTVLAQREAESLSASYRTAAERALPGVVSVRMGPGLGGSPLLPPFRRLPFGPEVPGTLPARGMWKGSAGGSGIVVDAERGLILTTASNVGGASQIWVVLPDGRESSTTRIVLDPQSDLAVLSIDPKIGPLTQIEWGDSEALRLGDWVLSVARPTGQSRAVSAGIFSGAETGSIGTTPGDVIALRSDVRVAASGNGGPLINLAGQVVGIIQDPRFVGETLDDFSRAIPASVARRIASELIDHGRVRHGYLGLSVGSGGFGPPGEPTSLVVSGVSPTSPAAEAGFQIGDRIRSIDGKPVKELDSLARAVEASPIGQEFRIEVERGRERIEINVKSRPRPESGGVIHPGPAAPGPRIQDRRLRPRRNPPIRSEGPEEQPDLSVPTPGTATPKVMEPLKPPE